MKSARRICARCVAAAPLSPAHDGGGGRQATVDTAQPQPALRFPPGDSSCRGRPYSLLREGLFLSHSRPWSLSRAGRLGPTREEVHVGVGARHIALNLLLHLDILRHRGGTEWGN